MLVMFTDTDTDMTPEVAAKYGYQLISMPYVIDGQTIRPYVDFDKFDSKAFYDRLRSGALPQTCAINPDEYVEYFEPYFKRGDDIMYVHFSEAMSGTFNAMRLAVETLQHSYPDRKFYSIDTKAISALSYNVLCEIGEMYKAGKTADEIVEWSKTEVDKFACYFYADNLKFFRRSGRVSNLAGAMGDLIGIHPLLSMDSDGQMRTYAKANGRAKTLKRLLGYVEELAEDIKEHRVIVAHSDALPIAENVADMLREKFGDDLNIEFVVVNPTAGSHCGPNCVGISFHCKHR